MPMLSTMTAKKAPNRSAEASCFVRMSDDDRDLLLRAAAKQLADSGIPDAKLTLGKFILGAAKREAKKILGEKER
jgi:uncharacterized protein (DUF1778 family)